MLPCSVMWYNLMQHYSTEYDDDACIITMIHVPSRCFRDFSALPRRILFAAIEIMLFRALISLFMSGHCLLFSPPKNRPAVRPKHVSANFSSSNT